MFSVNTTLPSVCLLSVQNKVVLFLLCHRATKLEFKGVRRRAPRLLVCYFLKRTKYEQYSASLYTKESGSLDHPRSACRVATLTRNRKFLDTRTDGSKLWLLSRRGKRVTRQTYFPLCFIKPPSNISVTRYV